MRTIRQLITDTRKWKNLVGTDIENNAKHVMLYDWYVEEAEDVDGDIFRDIRVKAKTNKTGKGGKKTYGTTRHVQIRLYGTDQFEAKSWVSCDCEYFKYTAEVALYDADSSDIKYSNGNDPVEKNPRKIAIICKHILAAFRGGAAKKPINKSYVKQQREIERKEKEAKEKEKAQKQKQKEENKKKAIEQARKDRERYRKEAEKKPAQEKTKPHQVIKPK